MPQVSARYLPDPSSSANTRATADLLLNLGDFHLGGLGHHSPPPPPSTPSQPPPSPPSPPPPYSQPYNNVFGYGLVQAKDALIALSKADCAQQAAKAKNTAEVVELARSFAETSPFA